MSTYNSVNDQRQKLWLENAVTYRWQKFFKGKRDKDLWIFSAWEGQKFSDNSKYLYEYMLSAHPEISCVWQTKNKDVFAQLKKENKPVQMIGTSEAEKTQKKAGVAFYTNGLDDFGERPKIYGAVLVSLWHGVGFKRMYREQVSYPNIFKLIFGSVKWRLFSWVKRDVSIVTSEESRAQTQKAFALGKKANVIIAGQPRNDIFGNNVKIEEVINNEDVINRIKTKKIVLYMPTFRKSGEAMEHYMKDIWTSEKVSAILQKNDAVFLAKLHYLNRGTLESKDNLILLNDSDVVDVQKLMCCVDVLVTDYSSCAVDFALQNKPILFYFPDWEEYQADECMKKGTREACSINCAESMAALEEKLEETLNNPENGLRQSERLNVLFDETGVCPGEYSENVYKKLIGFLEN